MSMSILDQRVYLVTGAGAVTDLTIPLSELDTDNSAISMLADVDYLYIGTSLPFNHRYFHLSTPNAVSANVGVDIWYANSWKPVVDILDRTDVSGTPLARSGNLQFQVDRDFGWDKEQDSVDIDELVNAPLAYDLYWSRINFDQAVSFTLSYLGQKFSDDRSLLARYPQFGSTTLKNAFLTGKTDWDEQHIEAAVDIAKDLIERRIAWDKNQVLDVSDLRTASVHRTASIIYRGLGVNRNPEQIKDSESRYHAAMNKGKWKLDVSGNGMLDETERKISTIFMTR